jgi:ribonuclease D
MEPTIHWVSETAQLEALVQSAGRAPLALDTEADSLHHYPEKVCLVQLHVNGGGYLIDPLSGIDLEPLTALLVDRGIPKILHGADYDLRALHRDFGLEISGLFDTMVAARLVGETAFGLAALVELHFGVELDKKYQRADWSRRPLPAAMARYAALDTRYLEPLAAKLSGELRRLSRTAWAEEEFLRLEQVRWKEEPDPEAYRRIKGARALSRRGLAALRELSLLREAEAVRSGRPPFRVLSNEALIRLAGRLPSSPAELNELTGLPAAWSVGRFSQQVIDAVRTALELPEKALPKLRPRKRPARDPRHDERVRELCRARDALAASLGLEPAVLAARSVMEQVSFKLEVGRDPAEVRDLRRWQAELLRPVFDKISA